MLVGEWGGVGVGGDTTYSGISVFSLSNKLCELNNVALKAGLDKRHLDGRERMRERERERERESESECEQVRTRNKEILLIRLQIEGT